MLTDPDNSDCPHVRVLISSLLVSLFYHSMWLYKVMRCMIQYVYIMHNYSTTKTERQRGK